MKNNLAIYRKISDLSQEELSLKAGVSRTHIANIERGTQQVISNAVMEKLANALERSVCDIFFNDTVVYKQHTN